MLIGAISGEVFAGVASTFSNLGMNSSLVRTSFSAFGDKVKLGLNAVGRTLKIATNSIVGGLSSKLSGGSFANGARAMAFLQLFKEAPGFYKRMVGYDLDASPGGAAVEKGPLGMPVSGANNIGTQDTWRFDSNGQRVIGFFEEGGPVSRFFNHVFGGNAIAGMHDVQQVFMGNSIWRDVLNVPGMAIAVSVTYSGFVGQMLNSAPNYLYVPILINDDDREPRDMWMPAGGY